jgi:hypothetical protein
MQEGSMPRSFHLLMHRNPAGLMNEKRLLVAAIFGIAVLAYWSMPRNVAMPLDPACADLDRTASARVAELVGDSSDVAQAMLGDAVFKLKRARSHCRNGWVTLARLDYSALQGSRFSRRQ